MTERRDLSSFLPWLVGPLALQVDGTDVDVPRRATVNLVGSGGGEIDVRPAAGTAGRIFTPSDGFSKWVDTGTVWKPDFGVGFGDQPPLASTFTVYQVGSNGTLADDAGTLLLSATSAGVGTDTIVASQAVPNGVNGAYTLTVAFLFEPGSVAAGNFSNPLFSGASTATYAGVVLQSGTTAATLNYFAFAVTNSAAVQGLSFYRPTAGAGLRGALTTEIAENSNPLIGGGVCWMRVVDDGAAASTSNITWSYSRDGRRWTTLGIWGRDSSVSTARPGLVATRAGFFVNAFNCPGAIRVLSYTLV